MKTTHLSKSSKLIQRCKGTLACATAALALNCAWADPTPVSTITMSDLTDGPVIVTTDNAALWTVVTTPEVSTITGTIPFVVGTAVVPVIPLGSRSVLLTEPSTDPFGSRVSDIVTLSATQIQTATGGLAELINVQFWSDGAPNFDALAARLQGLQTPGIPEDGTLQDLSTALNSGGVKIIAQSDFGSNEAPDATSTAGLLGMALAGIAWFARNRRATAI